MSRMKEGWYLLKARTKQEQRAYENLENQGFDAFCPIIKRQEKGKVIKEEVLFPGYLFLYLDLKDLDRYYLIRSTRGVSTVVQFNQVSRRLLEDGRLPANSGNELKELLPQPIPNGENIISQIKEMVVFLEQSRDSDAVFHTGDVVTVCNPLFDHLKATFIKGISVDRGVILIEYIKQQRSIDGTVEEKHTRPPRKLTVKLKDLKKADGYQGH
ncbi:hypothetical protein [Endozoicomonas sp. Mp262]|uniref:transcription termination/antitermination NusG family protein n=1 Tax=Endozoicomonas sp. Mp262 TaxID=2919499 RepID=UPI0021DB7910